jgi:hypothetical protein
MSLDAVIDIVFHFGTFKTYDMLAQGSYRIRVKSYYYLPNGQKKEAVPYLFLDSRFSKNHLVQKLFDSVIDGKKNLYTSPSFYVRYCDQEFDINQMVIFRFLLEGYPNIPQEFFFEVDLTILELNEDKESKEVPFASCRASPRSWTRTDSPR